MTGARGERLTAGGRAQLTSVVRENPTEADILHGFSIRAKLTQPVEAGIASMDAWWVRKMSSPWRGLWLGDGSQPLPPLKTGDSFQKLGWLMHSCLRQLLFLAPSDTGEEGNK